MNTVRSRLIFLLFVATGGICSAQHTLRGLGEEEKQSEDSPSETRQKAHERKKNWGMRGSDMVNVNAHFADLWDPYDETKDTPFFFMVPKSGTSTLSHYFGKCLSDVAVASHLGGAYVNDHVEVVDVNGRKYVNIDPENRDGLEHAKDVGIAESALAGVLISGYVHQVADTFNKHNQARMFTLLRNPLDRTLSEFYYVQVAHWEQSYKPWLKDWTLDQYVQSDIFVDNFMTRQLVGKSSKKVEVTRQDMENAMHLLSKKCLIGLLDDYEESVARFRTYFGWTHDEDCFHSLFHGETAGKMNSNSHPTLPTGSAEWEAVVEKNRYDMQVYTYAVELFERQAGLFYGDRQFGQKDPVRRESP